MMDRHIDCETPGGRLRVRVAGSFVARGLGLLVGAPLQADEGLLITPCGSIHTLGMRYAIDVVFLHADGRVLRICPAVGAGRVRIGRGARSVLELQAGAAARHGLVPGLWLAGLADAKPARAGPLPV